MTKRQRLVTSADTASSSAVMAPDLLSTLVASNESNHYIVIEALAGCGKTALLTNFVERLDDSDGVLLLSFTQQAVTVAKLRAEKDAMSAQTFDSFFYHSVNHCLAKRKGVGMRTEEYTFEDFRNESQSMTEDELATFVCKADAKYVLKKVQYILVDEAQDTPPQALAILNKLKSMGKTVIVTGDRRQAIFGFMHTDSLFDRLPARECVRHQLLKTRRCCPCVVEYLNERFCLSMESGVSTTMAPDVIETVCVQTKYNATLGRLYTRCLFALNACMEVSVSDGESTATFWDAVYQEAARLYSLPHDKAVAAVKHRQGVLHSKHSKWEHIPVSWRTPKFIFSTVYHFKGGECDVTIVADDVELDVSSAIDHDERVKYVAGSRARWGIVNMRTLSYRGHEKARRLLYRQIIESRECSPSSLKSFGPPPRISSVTENPACTFALATCPTLNPWMERFRCVATPLTSSIPASKTLVPRPMLVGTLVGIAVEWMLEREARRLGKAHVHVNSDDMSVRLSRDRQYTAMKRQGMVGEYIDQSLRRTLARMKIRSALSRYLVVFHGWNALTSFVMKGAYDRSRLRSFVMCFSLSALVTEGGGVDIVSRMRVGQLVQHVQEKGMPGVLGSPETWVSLNIQQSMPRNATLYYRGEYDVLILDTSGLTHLVEVKTVHRVTQGHALQATLYAAVVDASMQGIRGRWKAYVFETNRNELLHVDVADLIRPHDAVLQALNVSLSAKTVPTYFSRSLTSETLNRLMC